MDYVVLGVPKDVRRRFKRIHAIIGLFKRIGGCALNFSNSLISLGAFLLSNGIVALSSFLSVI